MDPIVRYMVLCDNVRIDPDRPLCANIECVITNIVSLESPPFPLVRELVCVYLALTACRGNGTGQIRVAFLDNEGEQLLFGSPVRDLSFAGHSPLETLGIVFRLEACPFARPGRYSVQFCYNGVVIEQRHLELRG